MPCNSDYMEQTALEARLQETAKLCEYVYEAMGEPIPGWVMDAAREYYCSETRSVPLLCRLIQSMPEEQLNKIMYDGKNPWARALAGWWEEHQMADKEQLVIEEKRAKNKTLIESALKKLTKEEADAMGCPEDDAP